MKKKVALLLSLTMILFFTACAGESSSGQASSAAAAPAVSESGSSSAADLDYPKDSVEFIVPWSAGGANDLYARVLSEGFLNLTGVANPVVNIEGASGSIGFAECLNGEADGYTVCGFSPNIIINSLDENCTYNLEDVQYIIGVNEDIRAICVPADSPFDDLQGFIDYAKEHPGELNVAHGGAGTISYYALVDLENKAGIDINPIPFNGATPGITACLGGHVDACAPTVGECLSYVQSGQMKCVAVLGNDRAVELPDVGTAKEIGIDCVHTALRGIFCKAGTPEPIVQYLHDTYKALLDDPEIQEQFAAINVTVNYYSAEEVTEMMNDLYTVYAELMAAEKA